MTTVRSALCLAGLAALVGAADPALADPASPAALFVVHGIPGRELGASTDPELPVDVLVNGQICLLKNFTFGSVAGPFDLPAGTYEIKVSLASVGSPCGNAPVITQSVPLAAGSYAAGVAALASDGTPTIDAVGLDFSAVPRGEQRVIAVHAARAPNLVFGIGGAGAGSTDVKLAVAPDTAKSLSGSVASLGNDGRITVRTANGNASGNGAARFAVRNRGVVLAFAVGSSAGGTLSLATRQIENVK